MKIYKLQLLFEEGWKDFYLNIEKISGFYIPSKREGENFEAVNVLFDGDEFSFKQEPHLMDYLKEHFSRKAITNDN